MVTEKAMVMNYFCGMDPSVQFLLGNHVPSSGGATIHSIEPVTPVANDDNKIAFTLDVAMRLDQEQSDEPAHPDVVVPITGPPRADLADSA